VDKFTRNELLASCLAALIEGNSSKLLNLIDSIARGIYKDINLDSSIPIEVDNSPAHLKSSIELLDNPSTLYKLLVDGG
jgi:hypothetical protein